MDSKKIHYKMYKAGKNWLFASIVVVSFGLGSSMAVTKANADSTSSTSTATSDSTSAVSTSESSASSATASTSSETTKAAATSEDTSSTAASASSETTKAAAASEDTSSAASTSSAQESTAANSTATTTSSSAAASTSSASSENTATTTTNTATTDSSSTVTDNESNSVQVSYTTLLSQLNADATLSSANNSFVNVTAANFLDYFTLNGSATYDESTGIVTLTTDNNNLVGNFSLKSKIDMNTSFTLTGSVNLGSDPNGADGIGFAFHNGNTSDVGNAGGNLGIGGLQNAIGFKLDTWSNGYQAPDENVSGAQVSSTDSNAFGWSGDSMSAPYGTFVTTSDKQIETKDGTEVQRWWAEDVAGSAQSLSKTDIDGQFHNFVVSYDGSTRLLTIEYTQASGKVLTWSTTVDSSYQAMALIISASTGGAKNLQQFKITSFDFQEAATVDVKYVDQQGNVLTTGEVTYPSGPYVNGTYTTEQKEIQNYKFVGMGNSMTASGNLTENGSNGTVIYVYAPDYQATSKTVNETINYVDQNGKTVAASSTSAVTFVTVTNPVDGSVTYYYKSGAVATPTIGNDGVPEGDGWTQTDSASFAEVANPTVAGYKVISNDAPASDLTKVAAQQVTNDSTDLNYTVVYAPDYQATSKTINETINYVDQNGKSVADSYKATPVTFVTVTNPADGSVTYYYKSGAVATPTISNDGVPEGDGWTKADSADFTEVANPTVTGYKVISNDAPASDLTKVAAQQVTNDSTDLNYTVVYAANKEAAKVTYIDDTTGKTLSAKDLSGSFGTTDDYRTADTIKDYENQGYVLVSDGYPTNGVVYDQDGVVKSYEVHLTHGTTENTESSKVNETIHYVYSDGSKAADDYNATALEFTRTVTTDKVTGEKTYGAWTAKDGSSFTAVTSPTIAGYTPDQAAIAQIDGITGDSKDIEKTVVYTKNADPVVPTTPVTPATPTTPTTPATPTTPTTPTTPSNNGGNNNTSNNTTLTSSASATTTPLSNVTTKQTASKTTTASASSLPQTGDEQSSKVSVIGTILIALASIGTLFGLGKRNKKESK